MDENNQYGEGLLAATRHMLEYVQNRIDRIKKKREIKPGPRQISESAKLLELNRLKVHLKVKEDRILKKLD